MFNDTNLGSSTTVLFKDEARRRLFAGLKIAADAVGCTLGPKGKTVLIQRNGESPIVTKDGVTVSKSIRLKDNVQRMGADLIRESASQTNDVAGDGTTTSTVLTYAMVNEGLRLLETGYSAKELCHGIKAAVENIDAELVKMAKQLTTSEEISQVGTISANGDKAIGDIIAGAMQRVGKDGVITVEDAKGTTTSLDVVEGMHIDRGYLSPYFVNNPDKMHALYHNTRVLVTDKKLSSMRELIPVLESVVKTNSSLLIIADDVEGEALQGLVVNRVKSNLQVVAIKAPGYGMHREELLNDICVLTGGKLVSSSTGLKLEDVKLSDLGTLNKVVVDAKGSTLVGTGSTAEAVTAHVTNLKSQLADVTFSGEDVVKLKTRIAKLAGGVAVIHVGGATEVEMIERKYRIEDALNATRAAADEGIVPGGGMALIMACQESASKTQKGTELGTSIVVNACNEPIKRIIQNAGGSPEVVLNDLRKMSDMHHRGYNAATGEYVDMMSSGIVDPVKVTRTALKNAASVATTFLSLDAVIVEETNDGKHE